MTHIMDTHLLGDVQFDVHDHVLGGLYIEPCIDGPGCSRPPHTHTQCESQAHNCPHTLPRVLAHTLAHTHTHTHTHTSTCVGTHTHTHIHTHTIHTHTHTLPRVQASQRCHPRPWVFGHPRSNSASCSGPATSSSVVSAP